MTSPVSPSETIAKAMEGVTPDKLRYEADGMYAAVNGEEYGDTFHLLNWNDKPHRVVFDAIDLLRSAADHLDATALQLEAMQRENAEMREALRPFSVLASRFSDETSRRLKPDNHNVWGYGDDTLTYGDFRRARTLIQGEKK